MQTQSDKSHLCCEPMLVRFADFTPSTTREAVEAGRPFADQYKGSKGK